MKKIFYISMAVVLWSLIAFILHVVIEVPIIYFMIRDFDKYSFGLSWDQLMQAHYTFAVILVLAGGIFGIWCGLKWWDYIYVQRRYRGRWFKIS